MSIVEYEFGECESSHCQKPTPWDMPCIIVDTAVYCSETCAIDSVCEAESYVDEVVLHDPQYAVDRTGVIEHVDDSSVNIIRVVSDGESIENIIREVSELYPGELRV